MDINDFLSLLEKQVREDGVENTLQMIKSQNIRGPSAAEFFGEEFGAKLDEAVAKAKSDESIDNGTCKGILISFPLPTDGEENGVRCSQPEVPAVCSIINPLEHANDDYDGYQFCELALAA